MEDIGGNPEGDVRLDGARLDRGTFTKDAAVVTQNDIHWPFLTCRETVSYAARLYDRSDSGEADRLLKMLGLESCADTRIGNQFVTGLSGGQKRRTSIAVALVKRPKLLIMDEPTSGLDAAAAANIMQLVKDLARDERLVVLATIHQPSAKVYEGFDQVMLLAAGRVAYQGPTTSALSHFNELGHVPENESVAEFMLRLVNNDFAEKEAVDAILDAWIPATVVHDALARPCSGHGTPSLCRQLRALFSRSALLVFKDPVVYFGRSAMMLLANCFFSVVYVHARNRTQEQVLNRLWLMMWFVGVTANMAVLGVYTTFEDTRTIRREVRNGMVSPYAFLLARSLLEIPFMFLMSACALTGSAYLISNFHLAAYPETLLLFAVMLWSFECLAQLCAVLVSSPLIGMLIFLSNWFQAFLFSGVMVPFDSVVWPLRLLTYMLPFRYTIHSMAYFEFKDALYDKASLCFPDQPGCNAAGFKCDPGISSQSCYGRTGAQVLSSLHQISSTVTDENDFLLDLLKVLAFGVVCKFVYMVLVIRNTTKFVVPRTSKLSQEKEHSDVN
eukprot:TRINITY_DN6551_c0_g1_i1.p1 TRINITY_DN6551_c0_g1~~TRINITY_DN6551_c0_g1_i1.p1  ORF type:complete len:557 (-),score=114.32 TRINITY_DN6551_c0_g1_i1:55-1725(-)